MHNHPIIPSDSLSFHSLVLGSLRSPSRLTFDLLSSFMLFSLASIDLPSLT